MPNSSVKTNRSTELTTIPDRPTLKKRNRGCKAGSRSLSVCRMSRSISLELALLVPEWRLPNSNGTSATFR